MHEAWLQRTRRTIIEEIFGMSDDQLFSRINSNSMHMHILQQFMPDRPIKLLSPSKTS